MYSICSDVVVIVACILQCRMEANYAHQQELDMIPLLMQKDYSPKGYVCNYTLGYARCVSLCSVFVPRGVRINDRL